MVLKVLAVPLVLAVAGWASQLPPSAAQAADAIKAAGANLGNNPVAQALAYLADTPTALQQAITNGFADVLSGVGPALNPELAYSYGGSPPVYPTPQGSGSGEWAAAYKLAEAMVAKMTNEEKNNITYGASSTVGCSGFSGSVPRLGFSGICLNDAESGVRTGNLVNGYPAQLHVGASWNRQLAEQRAMYIGQEFKKKGINVALGPVIGPIGRIARGGRNWEGFSNDPYLAGALVSPTITGLQQSVIACAKHYIANEQETNRLPFLAGVIPDLLTQSVSSNVDDRTLHELYLWPFYDAVKAGVGSVMCSYNRINNSYGCQNSKTMNGLLKTELGFQGFVVSDWNAQHTGIASANAGLDIAMPNSRFFDNNQLATAVKNGSVNATRLDDMATRILASWYRYAKLATPGMSNYANVDARDAASDITILQSAIEGHVLVKNVKGALPLRKPRVLSLFGYDAVGGSNTSANDPIAYPYGLENTPRYPDNAPFPGTSVLLFFAEVEPPRAAGPDTALAGTLITGGGSGAITPASAVAPYDAFLTQAKSDGTTLHIDHSSLNPSVVNSSDACIVLVNEQSSESWDRSGLADSHADTLIHNVAGKCRNTIVVIHNAGVRLVDSWIENPNISAVMFAHVPGQASGTALVDILYGRQSPSGRLPYTVAKDENDYGSLLGPTLPDLQNPKFPQSNFEEGILIDYKYFLSANIQPRFAFGYGLTYTTFKYSSLRVTRNQSTSTSQLPPDALHNSKQVAPEGGLTSLYANIANINFKVQNVGNVTAAEVPQLYLNIPGSPARVLRGFDKKSIAPGESRTFEFGLTRRDMSIWDTKAQQWMLQSGSYSFMVGKSVLDPQLNGHLVL